MAHKEAETHVEIPLINGDIPESGPGDVKISFANGGTPENGPVPAPEKESLGDAKEQGACQKFKRKDIIIGILAILLVVLVIAIIVLAEQNKKLRATQCPSDGCLHGWSQHGDWCYFPSNEQRDWDFSRNYCASYDASLVAPESTEEWDLLKNKKDEFWIDLQRETVKQHWTWPNGSLVTQFEVKGDGNCAFVSADVVSSTNCDNIRRWMCKKVIHAA